MSDNNVPDDASVDDVSDDGNRLLINSDVMAGIFFVLLLNLERLHRPIFSKSFSEFIKSSDIIKNIVIIWSIYFLVDYSDNKTEHPLVTLRHSLVIWVSFLIVSKQSLRLNIFNFILITIIYLLVAYKKHLSNEKTLKDKKETKQTIISLDYYVNVLSVVLVITSFIGLYNFYVYKKTVSKKEEFHILKFIFGSKI